MKGYKNLKLKCEHTNFSLEGENLECGETQTSFWILKFHSKVWLNFCQTTNKSVLSNNAVKHTDLHAYLCTHVFVSD